VSEGIEAGDHAAAKAVSAPAPTVFLGLSLGQAIVVLAWPVLLLSALYGFVLAKKEDVQALEAAVRARPAVMVVDVTEVMRANIAKGMSADDAVMQANASFQRLARAGYIVIDSNAVLASPPAAVAK